MKNGHIALCLGLVAIVVIGFTLFKGTLSTKDTLSESETPKTQEAELIEKEDTATTEDILKTSTETGTSVQTESVDTGIHIMPDGTVMANTGEKIVGARILANGTVQLQDGRVVVPSADMRETKTTTTKPEVKPKHVVIDVVGVDFSYDIKQIKVKKGDTVTINFKSNEGFHDWVVDEFNARTERVNEGGTTSVTFVADKVGTFQYYCSVMSHRQMGMVGYLVVEEQ